jgi:hypothetical protein
MQERQTAPSCIVDGCDEVSALSAVASGRFWRFTTFYCGHHYQGLVEGECPSIDLSRVMVERVYDA